LRVERREGMSPRKDLTAQVLAPRPAAYPARPQPRPPGVAQPKAAPSVQNARRPVAPAPYRPQPTPRVLQRKEALPQPPCGRVGGASAAHQASRSRAAAAPVNVRPKTSPARPSVPPAYHPQPAPKALQAKTPGNVPTPAQPRANHLRPLPPPAAPPQNAQPKMNVGLRPPLTGRPTAAPIPPAPYRPQAPKVLQAKQAEAHARFAGRTAAQPGLAAVQLKRQPGFTPPRAVAAPRRGVIQRILDEDFEHGGTPGKGETAACHAFAQRVSDFVDTAYDELISGNVKEWKGAKAATFLNMVLKGHSAAKTHAANAIEERVYALMKAGGMSLKWVPQFTEGMGSASKPDIVIHLPSGAEALVDITSERAHILRKAGGWTTSIRYVYVAEAYFNPIREGDIANIKSAIEKGGIGLSDARLLKMVADSEREDKLRAKKEENSEVREEFNKYGNFTLYALTNPRFWHVPKQSRQTAAMLFLRKHGVIVKGMRKMKGRRKPSIETLKKKRTMARKVGAKKGKKSAEQALKEMQSAKKKVVRMQSPKKQVVIHNFLK